MPQRKAEQQPLMDGGSGEGQVGGVYLVQVKHGQGIKEPGSVPGLG